MMDNRPIGVFDSGLGGLTAVRELRRVLPRESIIYFGDTARVPYGTRSRETIVQYARQDIAVLKSHDVKMIIAACGTVSSVAPEVLEKQGVPGTGVLQPTALTAAKATRNGRIGIIGTSATIRSGSYRRALSAIDPNLTIFEQACPLFVCLVENGFVGENDQVTRLTAERYLAPLREKQVDTLILGCTHFPIISAVIGDVMGAGTTLIDSGRETALYASDFLSKNDLLCDGTAESTCSFFVSDQVDGFLQVAGIFLGQDVGQDVRHIDINQF